MDFDKIELNDLEADNSMKLLADFAQRARSRPPLQKNGRDTYDSKTVARALRTAALKFSQKFFGTLPTQERERRKEEYFPTVDVNNLAKEVQKKNS